MLMSSYKSVAERVVVERADYLLSVPFNTFTSIVEATLLGVRQT